MSSLASEATTRSTTTKTTDPNENDGTDLTNAVSALDLALVSSLLNSGANPNALQPPSSSPLTGSDQPDSPLKMAMFCLSNTLLSPSDHDTLESITLSLLDAGADPLPAMRIAEMRYGPYSSCDSGSAWGAWRAVAAAAESKAASSSSSLEATKDHDLSLAGLDISSGPPPNHLKTILVLDVSYPFPPQRRPRKERVNAVARQLHNFLLAARPMAAGGRGEESPVTVMGTAENVELGERK